MVELYWEQVRTEVKLNGYSLVKQTVTAVTK